jgi:membrane-bound metal-dependent hydrolase YbcI (DUF457 family)
MAGFKTHIGASTAVGIGYGAVGYALGLPPSTCMVAAGLCSVSGMLPDLDSDSGVPVRETWALVAAFVPALMIPRFVQLGLNTEQMALAAGLIYLAIRFCIQKIFKRFSVHRGMWHSIPAAAIAGLLAFLIVSGTSLEIRLFKTAAVVLGFLVHLGLDEFYSVEVRAGRLRIKKSLGTALKFWTTKALWPNVTAYGKLALLVVLVIQDPYLMDQLGVDKADIAEKPRQWIQAARDQSESWLPGWDFAGGSRDVQPLTGGMPDSSMEMTPVQMPWEQPAPVEETARRVFDYPAAESPVRR